MRRGKTTYSNQASLQIVFELLKKCVGSNTSLALCTTKQCRRLILLDGVRTLQFFSLSLHILSFIMLLHRVVL
jgi:hypothetical protein